MSWIDKIKNSKFRILTGDGKEYFPMWKNANKSREYNTSVFEFINKEGSYVNRKKPKSAKYDLVFYFQGEDYLDKCDEFEKSASDSRYWTIDHPLYGTLYGQPLSLGRNDTTYNNTEISVEFWESINTGVPKKSASLEDEIASSKEALLDESAVSFAGKAKMQPIDQSKMQAKVNHIDLQFSPLINNENKETYRTKVGRAKSAVTNVLEDAYEAMFQINNLINSPVDSGVSDLGAILGVSDGYRIDSSIVKKLTTMYEIYNSLKEDLFKKENRNEKSFFESAGAAVIATVCEIVIKPEEDDYSSRKDVENVSYRINEMYNDYVLIMDEAQSPIEDLTNGFSLDFATHSTLSTIINKTLYSLFDIAFSAKQERSIEIEKDSNLIILTHKYFGLDSEDKNINKFRRLNRIANDKVFGIKKGSVIKYLA